MGFIDRFFACFKPAKPTEKGPNAQGLAKELIKEFEGLRLKSYTCPASKLTVGYGHVIKPHELIEGKKIKAAGKAITIKTAKELLEMDLIWAGISLRTYCTMPLTAHQEAALLSFIFNCGEKAFADSSLRKYLCDSRYEQAAAEFPKWVHAGSKKLQGLVRRREAEQELFLKGCK